MDAETSAMLAKYRRRLAEYHSFLAEQKGYAASAEDSIERKQRCSPCRRTAADDAKREEESPTSESAVPAGSTPWGERRTNRTSNNSSGRADAKGYRSADSHGWSASPSSQEQRRPPQRGLRRSSSGSGSGSAPRRQQQRLRPAAQARPNSSGGRQHNRSTKDKEDAFLDQLFAMQGRYYTSEPPDAMYIKSQLWVQKTRLSVEAARREREAEGLAECTFTPLVDPSPLRRGTTAESFVASERADEAVAQHLARLQAARRQKKEKEERLMRSAASCRHSVHELTVPHAPNLGAPVAESLPSLRKPCVPPLHRSRSAGPGGGQRERSFSAATRSLLEEDTKAGHSTPHGSASDDVGPSGRRHDGLPGAAVPPAAAAMGAEDADALRSQLTDKDAIIHSQRERIVSLGTELARVKAMVEQLQVAVAGTLELQRPKNEWIRQPKQEAAAEAGGAAAAAGRLSETPLQRDR